MLALVIESDRPEWAALKHQRLWTSGPLKLVASVGNFSQIEVANLADPVKQPLIVVVTRARIFNPIANAVYQLRENPGAAAAPAQNLPRDTRVAGITSINRIAQVAGVGGLLIDEVVTSVAAQAPLDFGGLPFILHPFGTLGNRLAMAGVVTNQAIEGTFEGYEYDARPEEVTLAG